MHAELSSLSGVGEPAGATCGARTIPCRIRAATRGSCGLLHVVRLPHEPLGRQAGCFKPNGTASPYHAPAAVGGRQVPAQSGTESPAMHTWRLPWWRPESRQWSPYPTKEVRRGAVAIGPHRRSTWSHHHKTGKDQLLTVWAPRGQTRCRTSIREETLWGLAPTKRRQGQH